MDKSPQAFRTIGEVADELGVAQHVLRFWESRFSQIKPLKRGGGRRYYRPDDVALLKGIQKLLHSDGLTIRGAQKVLRDHGLRHVIDMGGPAASDARQQTTRQTAQPALAPPIAQPPAPANEPVSASARAPAPATSHGHSSAPAPQRLAELRDLAEQLRALRARMAAV